MPVDRGLGPTREVVRTAFAAGRPRRRRPAGPGLHQLGHVQGLRGARPDLQARGPAAGRRPAAEEGRADERPSPASASTCRSSPSPSSWSTVGVVFVFSASGFMAAREVRPGLPFHDPAAHRARPSGSPSSPSSSRSSSRSSSARSSSTGSSA
ncbi:MAG: hypothetical protein MZU95_04860 [Desulfomicrobium escambiense]|nr:hypothetical protein [Desulfomicrobium escambiense]